MSGVSFAPEASVLGCSAGRRTSTLVLSQCSRSRDLRFRKPAHSLRRKPSLPVLRRPEMIEKLPSHQQSTLPKTTDTFLREQPRRTRRTFEPLAGAGPDRHRTNPGCSPDAACFRLYAFRCAAGARDGVFRQLAFPAAPTSHFFLALFRWPEATQERRGRLVKAAFFAPPSGRSIA